MKKTIFLVLALILPVLIYLFLQSFGNNQYELPVLYQDNIPEVENCAQLTAPYQLPSEFYNKTTHEAILIDVRFGDVQRSFINNELARVRQYFGESAFTYKLFGSDIEAGVPDEYNSKEGLLELSRCILLNDANKSFITLVDRKGHIRSYFDSSKKQEFDRMITEIEILNTFK